MEKHSWPTIVLVSVAPNEESQSQEVARILGHYTRYDGVSGNKVCALSDLNQLALQKEYRGCPVWVKDDRLPYMYITFGDWGWSIGPLSESPIAYQPSGRKEKLPRTGWKQQNSWIYSGFDSDCPIKVEGASRLETAKETVVSGFFDFFWKSSEARSQTTGVAPKADYVANDALANKAIDVAPKADGVANDALANKAIDVAPKAGGVANDALANKVLQDSLPVAVTVADSRPGSVVLEVNRGSHFKLGQKIVIGRGTQNEEENTLTGLDPLWLMQPTNFSHPAGSTVEVSIGQAESTWPYIPPEQVAEIQEWARVQCMSCLSGTQVCLLATFREMRNMIEEYNRKSRENKALQEVKEPKPQVLVVGDQVEVLVDMKSDCQKQFDLRKGDIGSILEFDDEGDAKINFHTIEEITWVYNTNLCKLMKQGSQKDRQNELPEEVKEPKPQVLVVGDQVEVLVDMQTDCQQQFDLRQGTVGSILQFDEEGDAKINFHGVEKISWVLKDNLDKLRKQVVMKPRSQRSASTPQAFDPERPWSSRELVTWTSAVARAEIDEVSSALKKITDDQAGIKTRLEKICNDPQGNSPARRAARNVVEDQPATRSQAFAEALVVSLQEETDNLKVENQKLREQLEFAKSGRQMEVDEMKREARRLQEDTLRAQASAQECATMAEREAARVAELDTILIAVRQECAADMHRMEEAHQQQLREVGGIGVEQTELLRALEMKRVESDELAIAFQTEQNRCRELEGALQSEQIKWQDVQSLVASEQARNSELTGALQVEEKKCADLQFRCSELEVVFRAEEARCAELQVALQQEQERLKELADAFQSEQTRCVQFQTVLQSEQSRIVELQAALQVEQERYAQCQRDMQLLQVNLQCDKEAEYGDLKSSLKLRDARCEELSLALQTEQQTRLELENAFKMEQAAETRCQELEVGMRLEASRIVELENALAVEKAKQSELLLVAESRETNSSEEIAMLKAKCSNVEGLLAQEQSLRAAEVNAFVLEVKGLKEDIARLVREQPRISLAAREEVVGPTPIASIKEMATVVDAIPDALQQPPRAQALRQLSHIRQEIPTSYGEVVRLEAKVVNGTPTGSGRVIQANLQRPTTVPRLGVQSTAGVVLPSSVPSMGLPPVVSSSRLL